MRRKPSYDQVKRALDLVLATGALAMLSPVFLVTAIAIKIDSDGPVLHPQIRVGKAKKPFVMYKFRSMYQGAEQMREALADRNVRDGPAFHIRGDPRVTRVGRILRKTCIDELPQLVNVIRGEMSIVGPRPPLPDEVEAYSPHHFDKLATTPGLTCYWQISDREATFNEWVEMDLRYLRESSFRVDAWMVLKTMRFILKARGDR